MKQKMTAADKRLRKLSLVLLVRYNLYMYATQQLRS